MHKHDLADLLTNACIPVRPLEPRRKIPVSQGSTVLTFDEPPDAVAWFKEHPDHNIGLCHGPILQSPVVCVDVDISEAPSEEHESLWLFLRHHGVKSGRPCWIQRTGRGNFQFFFSWFSGREGWPPPTKVLGAGGMPIDLLTNGYSVIAPSDTSGEPPKKGKPGGGVYQWVEGHAPWDIPIHELCPTPLLLISWWKELLSVGHRTKHVTAPQLPDRRYTEAIGEYRNVTLTSIAGSLAMKHSPHEVEALLLSLNQRLCKPPLADREVLTIALSINGREAQKGRPMKTRGDELHLLG